MQAYWIAQRNVVKLKAQLRENTNLRERQRLEQVLADEERKLAAIA